MQEIGFVVFMAAAAFMMVCIGVVGLMWAWAEIKEHYWY